MIKKKSFRSDYDNNKLIKFELFVYKNQTIQLLDERKIL